jgi:hypothetical protein
MSMKALIDGDTKELALVIGNGINRYPTDSNTNSWEALLDSLARRVPQLRGTCSSSGVSPPEFFDVLNLKHGKSPGRRTLHAEFCELMAAWKPLSQHYQITAWASRHSVPILTTNFDNTLGTASSSELRQCRPHKFTAFYPWSSCYAPSEVDDPLRRFAIWHINGMQVYRQSIRLGLSDYMGAVTRARGWLHSSRDRLFGESDLTRWPGNRTWMQVFLHKDLLIFGLGLGEGEVFLRWLLIERAKYFEKFPRRKKKSWYVYVAGDKYFDNGTEFFLRGVGVRPVPVPNYPCIYSEDIWGGAH